MKYIAGETGPVKTSTSRRIAAKNACTVKVEGPYAELAANTPAQGDDHTACSFCPEGMVVESAALDPDGAGGGTLVVSCVGIGTDTEQKPAAPTRVTYSIDMVETQYELKDHPKLAAGRAEILMWLATEECKRTEGNNYKYQDKDGELQSVQNAAALKFCAAWMHGIQNFVRHYPVVTKTSYYRRVPGLEVEGLSVSGGTVAFAAGIDTFDKPGITLTGFADTGWFKSGDRTRQSGDTTWSREEQWTWTPDGSDGEYAWIYDNKAIN